ncbi:response regulator [Spirosoma spitsbergense]|uniref:response regulator n=1 Tax=Spirosoma spitsbergense TaxID=431554 RepID=UPI00035C9AB0|nr:response regulator transcription factor [Spirosoma spitsbergense]
MNYTVAIVDDHRLMAQAIADLVQRMDNYEVLYKAENGEELIHYFNQNRIPDIVLLDVNMPKMNGFETALWLKNNYPDVKILALSINDGEEVILKMFRNGARGYLIKGAKPFELKQAMDDIIKKGFYYSDSVTDSLVKSLNPNPLVDPVQALGLTEHELTFIKLACEELTYAEIAEKMTISTNTVNSYQENVFQKLAVTSRVSLALKALRLGIVPM